MDAVQKANSGHPGMPMGMADIAEVLWNGHLRHNPANPLWPDRDRFVVSNGHGSMLLYALLHLTGYDLPIGELKRFRQLNSKTPGHPELGCAPGVETTTGPLGQGISNAVGMALAERLLAAQFNRPGFEIVDHHTYVFLGDGCMMEGVSHEACSLAGTLKLGKLIAVYDDNGISIDSDKGNIRQWYTDDVKRRFEGYGWQVIGPLDGHDVEVVDRALKKAKREKARPSLIIARTVIAKGAPTKANTGAAHGAPLGEKEVAATREAIGWKHPPFEVPQDLYDGWNARGRGAAAQKEWDALLEKYAKEFPDHAAEFKRRIKGELPKDWKDVIGGVVAKAATNDKAMATRKSSKTVLDAIGPKMPELIGGSADLTGSNNTEIKGAGVFTAANRTGGRNQPARSVNTRVSPSTCTRALSVIVSVAAQAHPVASSAPRGARWWARSKRFSGSPIRSFRSSRKSCGSSSATTVSFCRPGGRRFRTPCATPKPRRRSTGSRRATSGSRQRTAVASIT